MSGVNFQPVFTPVVRSMPVRPSHGTIGGVGGNAGGGKGGGEGSIYTHRDFLWAHVKTSVAHIIYMRQRLHAELPSQRHVIKSLKSQE